MAGRQGLRWIPVVLAISGVSLSGARDTRLLDASRRGDAETVEALLRQRVSVGEREPDGTTALHWAVHHNQAIVAEQLVRAGAEVSAETRYGVTPLSLACVNGNPTIVRLLLSNGANPNATLPEGETALMTAARTGNLETLNALLDRGASVSAKERWRGQTALMWAAAEGNDAAVRLLVRAGASLRERSTAGFTPLLYATRAGRLDAVRTLIDLGADVNEKLPNGVSPLVLAVMNANYELGALLLASGADPNDSAAGWTALHQIAWTRRPNVGHNNPEPVTAGDLDSLEFAKRLLAQGADREARVTKEPRTGLNSFHRTGATPFLLASKNVDLPLMRLLLHHGANPRATNAEGTNALMVAAGVGMFGVGEDAGTREEALEAVSLLIQLGVADVAAADANGDTALHGAAFRGANEIVQLLVDKGGRLDAVNKKGWTPLKVAEGIFINATLKSQPETAGYIRKLMGLADVPQPRP
ncbi:MAG: ankyrin repeat domain-containing protein [Vicinamibacterales bacterium]